MSNLLFDLDGTLVDSSPGVLNAFRYTFDRFGIPCPSEQDLMTLIGPPLQVTFEKQFSNPEEVDKAVKVFRSYYNTKGVHECQVYKGIKDSLTELVNCGHKLFVTTSKNQPMADLMIEEQELSTYFTAVYGALDNRHHKDDVIRTCLTDYQLDPTDTFIIGDTSFDMIGGQETGIHTVFANWGYGKVKDLQGCQVNHRIEQPIQLLQLFH